MKTKQLLPCPFCGGPALMEPWHGGGPDKRAVSCDGDYCDVTPMTIGETPDEAAENWNRRVYKHGE